MSIYILYGVISFDWHFPYAIRAVHAMWNMYIPRHILYTFCAGFARHLNCVYHPCHTLNNYLHTFRMFYPITHPIPYTHVTRLFISSLSVIIRGVPKRPIEALYLCPYHVFKRAHLESNQFPYQQEELSQSHLVASRCVESSIRGVMGLEVPFLHR
jgi:hypothetical protein